MREAGGGSNEAIGQSLLWMNPATLKRVTLSTAAERKNRRDGKTVIAMGV